MRPQFVSEEDFQAMRKRVQGGVAGNTLRTRMRDEAEIAGSSPAPALIQSFFVPGPLPGANDIIRKHHMVYSKLKSQWGLTIARCILVAKLKRVRHCHVSFTWNELHARRDPDNVIFGQKFVLDALRDTKIIPDDSREHILSLTHCIITYSNKPGVYVTIEEVEP